MKLIATLLLIVFVFGSGCASMMGSKEQSISVETVLKGDRLDNASCRLNNSVGTWFVKTPGSTTVHKSTSDLSVKCEKEPHPPGTAVVKSSVNGSMFGNIIAGGIIGVVVDAGTGAGFDYPSLITVSMGESISSLSPPPQTPPAEVQPQSAPAQPTSQTQPTPQAQSLNQTQTPPAEVQPQSAPAQPTSQTQPTPQAQSLNQNSKVELQNETPCYIKGKVRFKEGINIYDKEGKRQGEKLYYLPSNPEYQEIVIDAGSQDRWFCSEGDAKKSGFRSTKVDFKS